MRSLTRVSGLLILALLLPAETATAAEVVKDGSFDQAPASGDNPNWDEGWLVFSPICDVEDCGAGGGTVGPRSGNNWVWFGGTLGPEDQFVSQEVTIPRGPATLSFYLWLGSSSGNGNDTFRVLIDGTALLEVVEDESGYGSYKLVTIDVSRYVSDRPHVLRFEYTGLGGTPAPTNFSLDDISLMAGDLAAKQVTLKGRKSVAKGKKVKLTATVSPCTGHEGDKVELFRGKKRIGEATSNDACVAVFRVKVKRKASYQAVSPVQDADHAAGTSNKLRVRPKKPAR